jgi:hypothetical protein
MRPDGLEDEPRRSASAAPRTAPSQAPSERAKPRPNGQVEREARRRVEDEIGRPTTTTPASARWTSVVQTASVWSSRGPGDAEGQHERRLDRAQALVEVGRVLLRDPVDAVRRDARAPSKRIEVADHRVGKDARLEAAPRAAVGRDTGWPLSRHNRGLRR